MKTETPITEAHLAAAIAGMSILKFFPMDEIQHRVMAEFLRKLCGHAEGLSWLVAQMVNRVGEWPGPAQVRGIYCTRFKPADGVENLDCAVAGFTPEDCSQRPEHLQLTKGDAQRMLASIGGRK